MDVAALFDQMRQIDLGDLEVRRIGAWPLGIRAVMMAALLLAATISGHLAALSGPLEQLQRLQAEQLALNQKRQQKARAADHLDQFRAQQRVVQSAWAERLRQLPEDLDAPGLVEDITRAAEGSGLAILSLKLGSEHRLGFYAELPIGIRLSGRYHQLGTFVSSLASLRRIVTLHDFEIRRRPSANGLMMRISAKTYRHLEDAQ